MSLDSTLTATAGSRLPDATAAGFADKLYRLDGGHSLANDESVWTPGENVGRSIQFSSTCWLIQRGNQWLFWFDSRRARQTNQRLSKTDDVRVQLMLNTQVVTMDIAWAEGITALKAAFDLFRTASGAVRDAAKAIGGK